MSMSVLVPLRYHLLKHKNARFRLNQRKNKTKELK
jgi:hypothetical protein